VCSFSRPATSEPEELKIENGTFKWTAGGSGTDDAKSGEAAKASNAEPSAPSPSEHESSEEDTAATASTPTPAAVEQGNQVFELRDISLTLTPGKLTVCLLRRTARNCVELLSTQVVTGPTASGKTALLVRRFLRWR